jgi:hypothetical protein
MSDRPINSTVSMDVQQLTIGQLREFLDAINWAPATTPIRLTEHRGNQLDPTYWTIQATVPLRPPARSTVDPY